MTWAPFGTWSPYGRSGVHPDWDTGINWHLEQTSDQAPDLDSYDPLQLAFVRDQHLRSPNGGAEDEYISHLIRVSYRDAVRVTNRSLVPEGRTMVLDSFPSVIEFPHPNLLSVDAIDYVDGDGVTQQLSGSPEMFLVTTPSGEKGKPGTVRPLYGEGWPSSRVQSGAVRVTFQSGYPIVDGVAQIPEDITHGRLLVIGELYKQRSESVHTNSQSDAVIRARSLWMKYKAY